MGLFPLLVFKYYNFLNDSLTSVLESAGLHFALPGLNWAIPVGISFFTFQAVGYVLDVYHKRVPAEKSILDYALFVSFFPQVTSGPISTAKDLMPQIKAIHSFSYDQTRNGLQFLLWGMFLKLCVADRAGLYVDTIYGAVYAFTGIQCLVASIFYTIQIYCDFAGYSLMAIGISKTIGFDLINNFNRPYFATSITEFWKRWHISLTRWLTTHVYINLGGNRCSKLRQYFNIMVTFLVSGLWHGANWTFVIWGAIHGVLQVLEKALGLDPKGRFTNSPIMYKLKPVRILVTFLLVNFAWIFFRMPTFSEAWELVSRIVTLEGGLHFSSMGVTVMLYLLMCLVPLVAFEFAQEFIPNTLDKLASNTIIRWISYIFIASMILFVGVLNSGQFIYANF